jgi:hypothetical protein
MKKNSVTCYWRIVTYEIRFNFLRPKVKTIL